MSLFDARRQLSHVAPFTCAAPYGKHASLRGSHVEPNRPGIGSPLPPGVGDLRCVGELPAWPSAMILPFVSGLISTQPPLVDRSLLR